MNESATFDARFKSNFGAIVAGSPVSGKTLWTATLIRNADRLIDKPFDYIYWFYGEPNKIVQDLERDLKGKLISIHGLPENLDEYINPGQRGLHVYDDLFLQLANSDKISEICAYKTQHSNLSWIILMQNLFHNGKARQTIYRCAHYLCIFNNVLDKSQIYTLAYKLMPGNQKLFLKMFEKAANRPFGYMLIDGHQTTPQEARFRTDIFGNYQKVFIPN